VCTSSLRRPVEAVDRAVLDYLARNVLTEEVVTDALKILRQRLIDRVRTARSDVHELETEARQLREEIGNLVKAIAAGGASAKLEAVVEAVAERQERLREVDARIRAAKTAPDASRWSCAGWSSKPGAGSPSCLNLRPQRESPSGVRAKRSTPETDELWHGAEGRRGLQAGASPEGFEPLGKPLRFALVA
jgi:hypothetical protein